MSCFELCVQIQWHIIKWTRYYSVRAYFSCFRKVMLTRVNIWQKKGEGEFFPQLFRSLPNFHEYCNHFVETRFNLKGKRAKNIFYFQGPRVESCLYYKFYGNIKLFSAFIVERKMKLFFNREELETAVESSHQCGLIVRPQLFLFGRTSTSTRGTITLWKLGKHFIFLNWPWDFNIEGCWPHAQQTQINTSNFIDSPHDWFSEPIYKVVKYNKI